MKARKFFERQFSKERWTRPKLGGVHFNQILVEENNMLVGEFGEMEIKEVVWECGNTKCRGLDDLNFKFIKSFWHLFKKDAQIFLDDFHCHRVLPRGSNASFFSLLHKVDDT